MRFMIIGRASRAIIPGLVVGERRYRQAAWPGAQPKWRVCRRAVCCGRDTGCDRRAYGESAYARGDFVDGRLETEGDPTMQFMIIVKANSR